MPPLFPSHDGPYLGNAYPKLFRHPANPSNCLGAVHRPYFPDLKFCQFSRRAFFSLLVFVSAFALHILAVVFVGSEKQVIGVSANRIVTSMAREHPIGDRTKSVNPSQSVSFPAFGSIAFGMPEPVSVIVFCSKPRPALIGIANFYFLPKPFTHWHLPDSLPPSETATSFWGNIFDLSLCAEFHTVIQFAPNMEYCQARFA